MSITVELAPDLEQQLRQAAANSGLEPDVYIVEVLRARLQQQQQTSSTPQLSATESQLLLRINHSLSGIEWTRYHHLVAKRQSETLSADEQQELIALSDQIEIANANRIDALIELARLRNVSLDVVMGDLGLQPPSYA